MSVNEKMTAIADAIRSKTGGKDALTLDDMPREINNVYVKGYGAGTEYGKQSEHYRFWNTLQKGGEEELSYYWTFSNGRFTDENYDPIFPIRCSSGLSTGGQNIFYSSSITDTKVEIITGINRSITNCFNGCTEMHTIRKITTNPGTTYKDAFKGCISLVNIEMAGTCGRSIDFQYSPLSVASMKSVISCLYNYAGESEQDTYSVTFSSACWEALEASTSPYEDGLTDNQEMSWEEYVMSLGWLVN